MKLPKLSLPTKKRIGKEIDKTEGTLFVHGVLLVTLLLVRVALPDDNDEKE
jgi:hypothetical protein